MLIILIRSCLQGRELKPFNCAQVQDYSHLKKTCTYIFCSYVHSMNRTCANLLNDRNITFRMVFVQHLINEAPGLRGGSLWFWESGRVCFFVL